MGKLHELLAAEPDAKGRALDAVSVVLNTFKKGKNKFLGHVKIYSPLDEEGQQFPDEQQEISESVQSSLNTVKQEFGRWIDIAVEKEVSNQGAFADLALGVDCCLGLPATALLNLESKLAKLREVYAAIPTNDPARKWEWDGDNERYKSPATANYKTEKVPGAIVGYEATEDHPAQVQWFTKDIRVGEWFTTLYSGMIPPVEKRWMLGRIDELIVLVKQARQRANMIDSQPFKVADQIFDYIHQDV